MIHALEIFEQSGSPCLLTNSTGRILYANPALESLTRYSKEQLIGANPRVFRSGQTPEDVYFDLWSTISSGECWRGELLNRKKTGERYWEAITISPIENEKTGVTQYLGLLEDRTEEKRKASDRERLLETLRNFFEVRDENRMLPICSHCHSIRHANDEWEELPSFLDKLLHSSCSHGICPKCIRELYPEFAREVLLSKANKAS